MMVLLQFLLLSCLWGSSFVLMKIGVGHFGAFSLIFLRVFIGAVCLYPLIYFSHKWKRIPRKILIILFIIGLLNSGIPFVLLTQATLYLQSGLVSILNATTVLFTAIISLVWLKEKFNRLQLFGFMLSVFGLIVLLGNDLQASIEHIFYTEIDTVLLSVGMCLLATFCYGSAITASKKFLKDIPPLQSSFISLSSSSIALFPLAFLTWPSQPLKLSDWFAPFALAILCTSTAFFIYFKLLKSIGANKVATVTLVTPFFGVLWGIIIFDEQFSFFSLIGTLMILSGAAIIHQIFRPYKKSSCKESKFK